MDQHHDQVEADIPEFGGMVLAGLKEIIQFDPFVAAFRGSALVVHQMPLIATPWRRGIQTDVGFHGNGTGSAILGGRAGGFTGASTIVIQRAAKLRVLPAKVIAVGFHLKSGFAERNTIWTNGHAVVIGSFPGISQVEINVRGDVFMLAQGIHGHGVMSRVE